LTERLAEDGPAADDRQRKKFDCFF